MNGEITFDPLLPWGVFLVLGTMVLAAAWLAYWRGLAGWALRLLAGVVIVAALSGPSYRQEDRAALSDIVVLLEDQSASQELAGRAGQTKAAADLLAQRLIARPNTEVRRVALGDGPDNSGTLLLSALSDALAQEPQTRIAGIIALSDGQVHDLDRVPDLPAPMHLLLSGQPDDWDRRLVVETAPAFAILGEPVTLTFRIEDTGAAPLGADQAPLDLTLNGGETSRIMVPLGRTFELPVTLPHGGRNVIQFSVPEAAGELTDRNNTALIQINGVRDRLRVLLVSGEPHPGGRTWRNLLKSDSSVDLVHFTILRPPEKQDGVPVAELSLIAFPTRELFLEKIDDFDLIIFDRYKRRGILPALYLENVRRYVSEGGAVLIAAGPDFASADSIYHSPLATIVPARPTARVIEQGYRPKVTDLGERHPVTAGLQAEWPTDWGRWMRQVELEPEDGEVVMTGAEDAPLLILNRVGEGRIALLASDQAWLWARGFEGGGPQLELLRRLAHWMMKEPELEEELLTAAATGQDLHILRRTLQETVGPVEITTPSGETVTLQMQQTTPGQHVAEFHGDEIGLYRLQQADAETVIGMGPAAPREFEETIASGESLRPVIDPLRGGVLHLSDGVPRFRDVRVGRPASGRGWIGITPRAASETLSVKRIPLLPPWLVLLLSLGLILAAWLREGRR
ncbi:putative membrane protein [Thalassovita gelatinovora]|uniref:Putative membrane protein n=1 Tax=Thalassovita gelatinovora TaxID=53501 RepID=A0A0P1F5T1_THAGE|nr:glutamine amidotransferase [Thalassovita gelatinovora]QIZ80817.1 hypothetical protein HFZ77_10195 [Thalassovita gelatinovora]CUH63223.1 putative membrane protein [Thalassovita gelatinovora]SEQ63671.1 Putative glutamine amidotransferase [Thalassovita gelatinovora]